MLVEWGEMYYLHGGAGAPNFGDELIARQWLDFLSPRVKGPIVLSGYHQTALDDLFAKRYPEVALTSALSLCQVQSEADFWSAFNDGYSFFDGDNPASSRMPTAELERLKQATVFHLHGGGYINTLWPKHAFYLGLAVAIKKTIGCKIIATGIGLTPIEHPPADMIAKVKEAFGAFDMFEARDNASYDYAGKYGGYKGNVIMGLDDVFLLPPANDPGPPTLHISLHANDYGNKAADAIDPAFAATFDRRIFWACHNNDMKQFKRLSKRIPEIQLFSVDQLTFDPLPVGPSDFVITSRFHPHLMSARIGATGQYLAVGDYSITKHRSVVRVASKFVPFSENHKLARVSPLMSALDTGRNLQKQKMWEQALA